MVGPLNEERPMTPDEFRAAAHEMVDWMADFMAGVEARAVRPDVAPGDILARLPAAPPEHGEAMAGIFADFEDIVLPGMTHWQHPSFFAYFPGNSSPPSVLAEMLTATLGAQCMSWQTSPAATELEQRLMEWLRDMIGLPAGFAGVIQDTASTARAGHGRARQRGRPGGRGRALRLLLERGPFLGREGGQDRRHGPRQPAQDCRR
jgi:aromatic-L-amino-acid decarboxylase